MIRRPASDIPNKLLPLLPSAAWFSSFPNRELIYVPVEDELLHHWQQSLVTLSVNFQQHHTHTDWRLGLGPLYVTDPSPFTSTSDQSGRQRWSRLFASIHRKRLGSGAIKFAPTLIPRTRVECFWKLYINMYLYWRGYNLKLIIFKFGTDILYNTIASTDILYNSLDKFVAKTVQ